jgi:hypothetical protein
MAGPLVISILTKKYAQLRGEWEFAERTVEDAIGLKEIIAATQRSDERKRTIEDQLAAIETVIWLFDEKWDPAAVRPLTPRKKHWTRNVISRAALRVMREAGNPMSSREITHAIVARLSYGKLEEREMARIDNAVFVALDTRVGSSVLKVGAKPIRWSLIPRDQVRSTRLKKQTIAPTLPTLMAAE